MAKGKIEVSQMENVVTKEDALNDMKRAIWFHIFDTNGKYKSDVAAQYRDKMIEYGIYCKEEELNNWMLLCQSTIDSISKVGDVGWLYGAHVLEVVAGLLEVLDAEVVDWDGVNKSFSEQNIFEELCRQ